MTGFFLTSLVYNLKINKGKRLGDPGLGTQVWEGKERKWTVNTGCLVLWLTVFQLQELSPRAAVFLVGRHLYQ